MIDRLIPNSATPLHHWHASHGCKVENGVVVNCAGSPALGISDLTSFARLGFKGADTVAWLESQNWVLPDQPNRAVHQDGVVILRLSASEFFFVALNVAASERVIGLREAWSMDIAERVYLLERAHSHACFAITGRSSVEMLAKLCAVDLRDSEFEYLQVAQTSVARSTAIVTRLHEDSEPHLLVFSDQTSSEYLWECFIYAMHEYGGGPLAYPDYQQRCSGI